MSETDCAVMDYSVGTSVTLDEDYEFVLVVPKDCDEIIMYIDCNSDEELDTYCTSCINNTAVPGLIHHDIDGGGDVYLFTSQISRNVEDKDAGDREDETEWLKIWKCAMVCELMVVELEPKIPPSNFFTTLWIWREE